MDRATQLRIKYKNGALVTQSEVWSEVAGTQMLIGEVSGGTKTRLRLCFYEVSVSFRIANCVLQYHTFLRFMSSSCIETQKRVI